MKQRTQPADHPLAKVQWVAPTSLYSNLYNPNRVFPQELALLKTSIIEDGWTQPIVARSDGQIVDGFHRWTLASSDPEVAAITSGLVPVVIVDDEMDPVHQMMSTVRHNRARGQHGILKMAEIVRAALDAGLSHEDVCSRFGMEDEELDRLADVRSTPALGGKDSFGRGWVPDPET